MKTTVIPSPERLQETQLGTLGVPSRDFIYWYNATNVRKRNDSYDRVIHTDRSTNASLRLTLRHTLRHCSSSWVIPRHHWHHHVSTTGSALLLRIRRPRGVPTIRPVSPPLVVPVSSNSLKTQPFLLRAESKREIYLWIWCLFIIKSQFFSSNSWMPITWLHPNWITYNFSTINCIWFLYNLTEKQKSVDTTVSKVVICHTITGHAFIGSYYSKFHPHKLTHCPDCSFNPQTVEHIIQSCPCFA